MTRARFTLLLLASSFLAFAGVAQGRPYAGVSGLAASADSATTAGTNPAGMARFKENAGRVELVLVQSESEWKGQLGEGSREVTSDDSTTLVVPAAYTWPAGDRWMLSAGGLYVSSMVEDDERIFLLRMDEMWGLGFAGEWQWTEERAVEINFSYLTIGDAPIESPAIPILGSVAGEYTSRDIFILRLALNWGAL